MISPILFRNIIVLIFFIISVNTSAQDGWSVPINISATPDSNLAVDSRGNLHVIYLKRGEYRLYYITSENNWAVPIPYTEYGTQNAQIYVDKKDVIHFFWT